MREKHLDGLRGWAALFVLFSHLGPMFLLSGKTLPVVPTISDGLFAVYIFFALSGYVLSIHFFRKKDKATVVDLALRRYPRLTIPIIASCTLAYVMMKLGLFHNAAAGELAQSDWLKSFYSFEPSLPGLLKFSLWDVYVAYSGKVSYNSVLWTMSYEMAGSLIIFCLLLIFGGNRYSRVGAVLLFAITTAWLNSPLLAFALGMAIAGITSLPAWPSIRAASAAQYGSWLLLASGLGGAMWRFPSWDPYSLALLANMVLLAALLNQTLQRWLSTGLSDWLGKISFPLYLTHLLVICSLSSALYTGLFEFDGISTGNAVLVAAATIAASLATAQLFQPVEKLAVTAGRATAQLMLRQYKTSRHPMRDNAIHAAPGVVGHAGAVVDTSTRESSTR